MMRTRIPIVIVVTAFGLVLAGSAAADDMHLSKADVTELTAGNVGKPFWSLQAQCAGIFGAGYGYEIARQRVREANGDEAWGVSMLDASLSRLETDRGIDRTAALNIAAPEVEFGREQANKALDNGGVGAEGPWNVLRSACMDVSDAYARLRR